MAIKARKAEFEDVPAMAGLLAELFSIEKDFSPDAEKQARGLSMLLVESGKAVIAAEESGRVIGMVTGQLLLSTAEGGLSLLLEDLVVAKSHRGRGVGSLLLAEVEKWGRDNGALRLQLVADKDNAPAKNFYEKAGWKMTNLCVLVKANENQTLCPGMKARGKSGEENA